MSTSSTSPTYLLHVNGIRALAILGVLLYHLNADYCPSGYFGVDVFLVVSGYFLFRSLMNEEKAQQFCYGRYLLGKAWRILPSWFVCATIVSVMSGLLMLSYHAIAVFNTAGASCLFIADYYIDHLYDYFNDSAHLNALLHFWYLSITVQLYFIAPLLVMPLLRRGYVNSARSVLFLLACLSFAYYVATTSDVLGFKEKLALTSLIGAESIYYHLIPRMWEVVAGYCVVFLPALDSCSRVRSALAMAGMAGIVLSFILFPTGSSCSYLAVMSCILLLRYGDSGMSSHILAWRPVQFLGTISFSLYLWHWPVMVFWKYFCFTEVPFWGEIVMIFLSLGVGYVAWRWIERVKFPGCRGTDLSGLSVLLCIPVLLCVVFCGRSILQKQNVIGKLRRELSVTPEKSLCVNDEIHKGFDSEVFKDLPLHCGTVAPLPADFLLIGDSHAGHLYPGVHQACFRYDKRGVAFNNSIVPFWNCFNSSTVSLWTPERQAAFHEYLQAHREIKYVLISLLWHYRIEYGPYNSWEKRTIESEKYAQGLQKTCSVIRQNGAKVILLADTPFYPNKTSPLEEWGIRKRMGMKDRVVNLSVDAHREIQREARQAMDQLLCQGDIHAIIDLSVPFRQDGIFLSRVGDDFMVHDTNHLTPKASTIVGDYLIQELIKIMDTDLDGPR